MATKKLKRVAAKARNLLHDHPLLKKGGRHEQSKKSKRQQEKVTLKKEWFHPLVFAI